jgi:hypothetical protein
VFEFQVLKSKQRQTSQSNTADCYQYTQDSLTYYEVGDWGKEKIQ